MVSNQRRTVIVDIDGTLADCEQRIHYYKNGDYEAFNAAAIEDEPIEAVCNLVRHLPDWVKLVIMTARDASFREETAEWLNKNDIPFDQLLMRPEYDIRRDDVIKLELFEQYLNSEDIWFVLEDRQICVDMWRAEGLTCFQVAKDDC